MTVPTPHPFDPDRSHRAQAYDPWQRSEPHPGGGEGPGPRPPAPGGHGTPQPPGHGTGGDGGRGGGAGDGVRAEVRRGLLWGVALTVAGLLLGLLWVWLAPRTPLFTDGKAVFLKDPEGEQAIGADGTFVLLALAVGAVSGAAAFLLSRRDGGVGLVVGVAAGALLGSVVAWRFGMWLGPDSDVVAAAKAAGAHHTFDGPLKLESKGGLLAWPLAALAVHLLLTALFGRRDPEHPGHGEQPAPHWGGPAQP